MRAFLVGLAIGLCVGGSVAYAAGAYGTGYMLGWSVTKTVKRSVVIRSCGAIKEIECD